MRTASGAARLRVTAAYAVLLIGVSFTLTMLGPHARDAAVSRMSTNLHNLRHGHIGTLVGSAFVDESGAVYVWLPGLVCLLALGELIWRSRGLVVAFAVGHIGATLLVAVGLAAALEAGWLPTSVAQASDVGVSYGAVCVLGALTASIPSRWRAVWIGWWLGVAVIAALGADFTAFGHILALLLGIRLSFQLPSTAHWTPIRVALLSVSVAFGYFVLSGSLTIAPVAGLVAGLVGALIALLASRVLRQARSIAPERTALSRDWRGYFGSQVSQQQLDASFLSMHIRGVPERRRLWRAGMQQQGELEASS